MDTALLESSRGKMMAVVVWGQTNRKQVELTGRPDTETESRERVVVTTREVC